MLLVCIALPRFFSSLNVQSLQSTHAPSSMTLAVNISDISRVNNEYGFNIFMPLTAWMVLRGVSLV